MSSTFESITQATLDMGYSLSESFGTRGDPLGCFDAMPVSSIGWVVTSFVELLLFLPVLCQWKSLQMRKTKLPMRISGHGPLKAQDVMTLMARDSIVYFAVIILCCLLPTIIYFTSEGLDNSGVHLSYSIVVFFEDTALESNAYQTIVITIMTILAPKMLINLQAEYYGLVWIIATELSWDIQFAELSGVQIADEVQSADNAETVDRVVE
ncbi:uncharacterized protein FOMMEDRAFT_154411 [Fomitiporia mediterranea MF3/22]|uniref:uncharacterized protein n=1 Tax=Fomitiporia mediterranea (strain MF3/22) TaxID=694068 RepID=UPI0004408C6D|nr:uncharacterized protein FOMMEDRAFT_154411 [Fomitiporia mediterranea MF3/22]EJD05196.1 hypothetical protein FOMMEDRAFT_154411 [Fomitiporia mediterranea MF3/22]